MSSDVDMIGLEAKYRPDSGLPTPWGVVDGEDDKPALGGIFGDVGDAGKSDGRSKGVGLSVSSAPRIQEGASTASTSDPPLGVIRQIVRQGYGRFQICYANGLRGDPSIKGSVKVKFEIDSAGSVPAAADAGSTIQNAGVVGCILRGFQNMSFPEPSSGSVTVTYQMFLSPPGS